MPPAQSTNKIHPNKNRKVPIREKFAYGAGHVLNDMVTSFLLSFIAIYVTVGLQVNVTFAGYILFVILVTDALSRPLIIVLSRKIHICCYVGRRKSWHILGSVVLSVCIVLTFSFLFVPEVDEWPRFLVYAPLFILLAFAFTCAQVSHKAILREMTGLTSEKNLLSAWRSSSSLAANISVFVVAAIVLGVSGDVSSSAFTRGDAASFSYITYFILVVGGSCCIVFYLLVPEKTQTCEDAKNQFDGCCYRSKVIHPYGSTRASTLRRASKMATLAVDTGKMMDRRRSLSGGSGQFMSRRQSDGQTRSPQTLPPINNEETRTQSPRSFSKTGHLVINVQKVADGNKVENGGESKAQGSDSNKVTVQSKGQVKATTSGITDNGKSKTPNTPEKGKVAGTDTEKSQKQTPKLDLKKTANFVVNSKRVGGNYKAKQMLSVGGTGTGSRSPSPGVSGRKSRDVNTSNNISAWCCLCPKVKDKSVSTGQTTVKKGAGKSTDKSKNNQKTSEKSKPCSCWCKRQSKNDRSQDQVQGSNKKRDCCPWFKGMCKKPQFFKSVVIHACSKLAFLIAQVYMPLYLTESLAMGKITTAIVPLIVYIAGFLATLVTRKINAKYGRKRTFAIGEGCVLAASVWLFFIPVETSSQVYATACLLGVGLSTLQVRSTAMMTDLTGSPVDSGAAVFGVNEKAIQAVAILLLQVLSPCRLDAESDDCKLFYRSIMLSMPGGSTFISFLVLALAKVVGIDDEEQAVEVSDGNAIEISSSIAV